MLSRSLTFGASTSRGVVGSFGYGAGVASVGRASVAAVAVPAAAAAVRSASGLAVLDTFVRRHNGDNSHLEEMLKVVGVKSLDELVDKTVPSDIRFKGQLSMPNGRGEAEVLAALKEVARKNKVLRSFIGMGYYGTITPPVILRNLLENPAWYTAYTPYQPEVSQGRLESLLNFQTMVSDLTGLPFSNASLLDEATAAAEAMSMCVRISKHKQMTFFLDSDVHPQTKDVVRARAAATGITILEGDFKSFNLEAQTVCGALVQYPSSTGVVHDYSSFVERCHKNGTMVACATDLLALTKLKAPGEFGCDIAFGSSQRFGVPLGYGGPHAAFFATSDAHKRIMPGRIIGVSVDSRGHQAYRMALQTREQHIRRERATSNICTAQALLSNTAAMYALYHGPEGLKDIASRCQLYAATLAEGVRRLGHSTSADTNVVFDTITITLKGGLMADKVLREAVARGVNLRKIDATTIGVSMDETVSVADLNNILASISPRGAAALNVEEIAKGFEGSDFGVGAHARKSPILQHTVFKSFNTEHSMLRYLHRLAGRDITLATSMIPLGSCTMKLNATSEMIPVTWPEFGGMHPFAPLDQSLGYQQMFDEVQEALKEVTGFDAVSLQPNSGAMGEYTGLYAIREYHLSRGDTHRNVCLIPTSAHGTNPASAAMVGMKIVTVATTPEGTIDSKDLAAKVAEHKDNLSAFMVTYPSTFGIFDTDIRAVCDLIHSAGGQVYLDGANMNAQVGLCRPGDYGADVCHLNLHKTFAIPHGGGGPGIGPIGVKAHLAPFLPGHSVVPMGGPKSMGAVAAAPWGSAGVLPVSHVYIQMMGGAGLKAATQTAILNANYMMKRLEGHYKVLYRGAQGLCAHEFILDLRGFKKTASIEPTDIAKRLMDYGFHAPTMQFPVMGTLMIEPTESESKVEVDRLVDALIGIRKEIAEIEEGKYPHDNNVLKGAPHTADMIASDTWNRPYPREKAAYPTAWTRHSKYWPYVGRIDDNYGDKNLICACPPIESYADIS